jgi:hypothetical protein
VFQELALAPRTLFYGRNELFWRCFDLKASEIFPYGMINPDSGGAADTSFYNHLMTLHSEDDQWR